jgi:hypothetical protein
LKTRYSFLQARNGDIVPAFVLQDGKTAPLHSTVDPGREAQRLVSTVPEDTGFVIFLGLGGGFAPQAALDSTSAQIAVIDFDEEGVKELLSSKDYSVLLNNERFSLLVDFSESKINKFILEQYKPVLHGGIKVIPLRTRTEQDQIKFEKAAAAIQQAIDSVSADYSVQAHFGIRWFSNIIRNLINMERLPAPQKTAPPQSVSEAAIVAAGPSLDLQIDALLQSKKNGAFIICSDTALPVLLQNNIKPDIIVSIDCQHISHYHFIGCDIKDADGGIPLLLDIASPPMLSRFSSSPLFFISGHPLAQYISRCWKTLPQLDTSGGNVTYACLSLAESLGAKRITLYGADFSYVHSRTYARGTYVFPYFERKQTRLSPMEAMLSAFLYRAPFLPRQSGEQTYYETASLRFYRNALEQKAAMASTQISSAPGLGAPINLPAAISHNTEKRQFLFTEEKPKMTAIDFLKDYRDKIASITEAKDGAGLFTTILPLAAALKHRNPELKTKDLIEETKRYCIQEINKLI